MSIFRTLYDNIYIIGIYTYRYGKRFFIRLARIVKKPLSYLFAALYALYLAYDMFFLRTLHDAVSDYAELKSDVHTARVKLRLSPKSPAVFLSVFRTYIKKTVRQHHSAFSYMLNILLPAAALCVLLLVINHFGDMTFALKVEYDGQSVGYVESESVLLSAGEKAAEVLNSGRETVTSAELSQKSSYSISAVKTSELCGEDYVAEYIIETERENYVDACAVYINDTLLCLVRSESDAVYAFDKLLDERKGGNTDSTVSYVEDIEFRECLYPEASVRFVDADGLYNIISAVKTDAVTYTVKDGDDEDDILKLFDGNEDLLYQLNPNTDDITVPGTVITVSPAINRLSTKLTFTNERTITDKYSTVKLETDELYSGDQKVVQQGSDGKTKITELVTYVDGVLTSSVELKRTTVSETVDEIIKVGTKAKPSNYVGPYTVATTNGRFVWPVVGLYTVYSWYGWRNLGWHSGIDISGSNASGSLIVAAESGTVISAGWNDGGYGYLVIIEHSDGVRTLYGHCLEGSIMVKAGDEVSTGQAIARVGNTGYSFGAHLHFEVRVNGSAVNPAPYLGLN